MATQPFTFTSEDVRTYCVEQLEKDSRDPNFLSIEEYRQMLSLLVQAEQAMSFERFAQSIEALASR